MAVAVVRGRRRQDDPLPSPASEPSGPWPPLRNESPAAPRPTDDVSADPHPTPAEGTKVVPEPDGVPVSDDDAAGSSSTERSWVEPDGEGGCPATHPVKAKMSSKIFHLPGQLNYDRTTPDRCYLDAASAEADGLRAAKR